MGSERQREMARLRHLPAHLADLGRICGRPVELGELREPPLTDDPAGTVVCDTSFALPFTEAAGPRFRRLLARLAAANPGPVDVWTQHARACGPLRVASLLELDWEGGLDLGLDEVLVFTTVHQADRLLLDVSGEHRSAARIVVELAGPNWGRISYAQTVE